MQKLECFSTISSHSYKKEEMFRYIPVNARWVGFCSADGLIGNYS